MAACAMSKQLLQCYNITNELQHQHKVKFLNKRSSVKEGYNTPGRQNKKGPERYCKEADNIISTKYI